MVWAQSVDKLRAWMLSNHAAPGMAHAIMLHLMQWHCGNEFTHVVTDFPGLRDEIAAQDALGWKKAKDVSSPIGSRFSNIIFTG